MSNQLPKTVDPYKLAGADAKLDGELPLAGLIRLAPRLVSSKGMIGVQLKFGVDTNNTKFIKGSLSAVLQLVCQRCMEPMSYPINLKLALGMVMGNADNVRLLPDCFEPLLIEADSLDLTEMVEDELLLALPIVPVHSQGTCAVTLEDVCDQPPDHSGETRRPFANLSDLMKS